jgi:hypothetical protein
MSKSEERLKRKAQHEIAFAVCSTLLLGAMCLKGPARLPLGGWRCFIGRTPRRFEAWEWLRTRTSRSALAYAHVKAEAAADFETGGAGRYRVHSGARYAQSLLHLHPQPPQISKANILSASPRWRSMHKKARMWCWAGVRSRVVAPRSVYRLPGYLNLCYYIIS